VKTVIPSDGGGPVDKQIGQRYQESSVIALEERVRVLENRVTVLSDVIRILAHGLEDLPTAEPRQRPAAEAARRAYDLLLVAEPRTRGSKANSGGAAT
jgi:hypothetical protein